MSFNLNSRIVDLVAPQARQLATPRSVQAGTKPESSARRRYLLALAAASAPAVLPFSAWASLAPLQGLRPWGRGEYRWLGLLIYEASLWAGDDPLRPPLALRLDYRRKLAGEKIVEASLGEMRRFIDDPAKLARWGDALRGIFPDVVAGDHILGVHRPEGAYFYQGERLLGKIESPAFAEAFFAIWLDARTSAPALRAALLSRPAG